MGWKDTYKPAEDQQELKTPSWRDTYKPAAETVPPEEPSTLDNLGALAKASVVGGTEGLTLGVAPWAIKNLGTGIDAALKASGDLFVPEGGENPYEKVPLNELYDKNASQFNQAKTSVRAGAPDTYDASRLIGAVASPGKGVPAMIAQGGVEAFTGSDKSGLGLAGDVASGMAIGGTFAKGGELVGSGLSKLADTGVGRAAVDYGSKVKDYISNLVGNNKFGDAFRGGEDIRKYGAQEQSQDLANRMSKEVSDIVGESRKAHAGARETFTNTLGDTPMDTSSVAANVEASLGRHGANSLTAGGEETGSIIGKEKEMIEDYVETLKTPQSATSLYKLWDTIDAKADHYKNLLKTEKNPINYKLKELQAGIKEKLHSLDPGGMGKADAVATEMSRNVDLINQGVNPSQAESFLSTLGNRNRGNRQQALENVIGKDSDTMKDINDYQTWQSFNGQGGFGSEFGLKTLVGGAVGSTAGFAMGGDGVSSTTGGVIGGMLFNGKVQRAALTRGGDAFRAATGLPGKVWESIPGKYRAYLEEAAKKGGRSLAIAHFTLSSQDPDYQAATQSPPDFE